MAPADTWPECDPELIACLDAAPDRALHELMCDCAAHALEVCEPIHLAAGYTSFPEEAPLEVKRRWLAGEATTEELEQAQSAAVWYCYWGSPIALGAAVLGAAWYPGSGLALAEDEQYAESMTYHDSAAEAARDVMSEAVKAVGEISHRARWRRDAPESEKKETAAAALQASHEEERWQRDLVLSRLGPHRGPG